MDTKIDIKIATWFRPSNYGTALQALALRHFLESHGYMVAFIEDKRSSGYAGIKENFFLKKIKKGLSRSFWLKLPYRLRIQKREQLQSKYVDKYCGHVILRNDDDVLRMDKETNLYISGGDQIWNPYVIQPINFLEGLSDSVPKISCGTSVGVKKIPDMMRSIYKQRLSRYSAISVREETSKIALNFIERDISIIVDPTLLLNADEWKFLIKDSVLIKDIKKKYILCYFVGERREYWWYVEKIRNETGYGVVVLPINDNGFNNKYKKYIIASPAEFLDLIRRASIVCTDSFHATIFSVQFQKEFYVLKRFDDGSDESQNSRLHDFLAFIGLNDHLIEDETMFSRIRVWDVKKVSGRIEEGRDRSREWILKTIETVL